MELGNVVSVDMMSDDNDYAKFDILDGGNDEFNSVEAYDVKQEYIRKMLAFANQNGVYIKRRDLHLMSVSQLLGMQDRMLEYIEEKNRLLKSLRTKIAGTCGAKCDSDDNESISSTVKSSSNNSMNGLSTDRSDNRVIKDTCIVYASTGTGKTTYIRDRKNSDIGRSYIDIDDLSSFDEKFASAEAAEVERAFGNNNWEQVHRIRSEFIRDHADRFIGKVIFAHNKRQVPRCIRERSNEFFGVLSDSVCVSVKPFSNKELENRTSYVYDNGLKKGRYRVYNSRLEWASAVSRFLQKHGK